MHKILIIDDDEEMCSEIFEILTDEGYFVNIAFDGLKGFILIEVENYNLILLDLKIPNMNGYEILKKIRELNKPVKVIILTGRPFISNITQKLTIEEKKEEEILKLADFIIQKPFNIKHLIDKIKEYLP